MKKENLRYIIKVAILCLAVSLLSFFAGALINPFFGSENVKATVPLSEIGHDMQKLKPVYDVIKLIQDRYVEDVELDKLIDGAIEGVMDSLGDPYSVFMDEEELSEFITTLNGSFSGVGIVLSVDETTGEIIVISPIEGTPAYRAGILPRDIIVKVDDVDLTEKTLDDAVKLLRGEKGTKVTVYIKRQGYDDDLKFELIRDDIRVTTVKHEILEKSIGYIKITSFDSKTYEEFKTALDDLNSKGVKGLILDLRNNPGGSLYECVEIADEILGEGLIVYTEDKNKNKLEEYYSDENKNLSVPLIILINENSASASEIVAGAVQDNGAGLLLGTTTFGKGSVQELIPFENKTGIKLTIARYYLPSGRSIDGKGVKPDVEVKLDDSVNPFNVPADKDTQLQKAIEIINSTAVANKEGR